MSNSDRRKQPYAINHAMLAAANVALHVAKPAPLARIRVAHQVPGAVQRTTVAPAQCRNSHVTRGTSSRPSQRRHPGTGVVNNASFLGLRAISQPPGGPLNGGQVNQPNDGKRSFLRLIASR